MRGYEQKDTVGGDALGEGCVVLVQGPPKRITGQGGCKEALELSRGKTDRQLEEAVGGTSLVVQWLRIHLAVQGAWVPSLVRALRPHAGSHMVRATKFVCLK